MNTLKKIVAATTIAITALGAVGTTANAGDWRHRGHYGYGGNPGYHGYAPAPHYYGHAPRRDRSRDRIGAAIAIGVGAAILGGIIASQNRRGYRY